MNTLALDPKPWRCIGCTGRFAHEQKSAIHWTEFRPRPLYSHNRGDYA